MPPYERNNMWIEPRNNIRLLHNVPLDVNYEHTIYWTDKSAQMNYFLSKVKKSIADSTYQRVNKGTCRVGANAESLYDVNYMMFQNWNFGNKWFYAFVNKVDYINDNVSEISYTLDEMQTWATDYVPNQCFVVREHPDTDNVGDNITPEPISASEYVFNNYEPVKDGMENLAVIVAIADVEEVDGELYDGVYGAATLYAYDLTEESVTEIDEQIAEYYSKPDSIIGIYMCPSFILPENGGMLPTGHIIPYGANAVPVDVSMPGLTASDTIDGYEPKNKKLFTYPYNFIHIDNSLGDALDLKYEFFEQANPSLFIMGTFTQPVQIVLRPKHYKGSGEELLSAETLEISGYPMCSWNMDAWKAWVAQNKIPAVISGVGAAAQIGINYAKKSNSSYAGYDAAKSGISYAVGLLSEMYHASNTTADIVKGVLNNGGANVANKKQQFYWGRCSINAKQAQIVDDFFTLYGYAINRVKVPDRHGRPHWNYVKTSGCTIHGSIPADAEKVICSVYDKGVTFWRNGEEIGNYSLDNRPVAGGSNGA